MRFAIYLFVLSLASTLPGFQDQKFGIATYKAPATWKEEKGGGHISYTKTEGSNFAQIALYEVVKSKGDIHADFDAQWKELVANGKEISAPEKVQPATASGWTAISGSGTWKFEGADVATILTVYSNKKVCVSVLINFTDPELAKEYVSLLESLSLDASKATVATTTPREKGKSSIVGFWVDYDTESRGVINGIHQLTGGYFRREYLIKADGTYTFRVKDWSVFVGDILFIHESGSWTATGDRITFKPTKGTGGWWSKAASGRTSEWGKFKKSAAYKPQPSSYTFDLHYYEGTKETHLILMSNTRTLRDKGSSGDAKVNRWTYTPREPARTLIDNPPGFKLP